MTSTPADWVGAIGSAAAAFLAVVLYGMDKLGERKRRQQDARDIAKREALIVQEAERLAEVGRARVSAVVAKTKLNPRLRTSEMEEVAAEVGRAMRRLNELKDLASFNPKLFSQIGQVCDCFLLIDPKESGHAFIADCEAALRQLGDRVRDLHTPN